MMRIDAWSFIMVGHLRHAIVIADRPVVRPCYGKQKILSRYTVLILSMLKQHGQWHNMEAETKWLLKNMAARIWNVTYFLWWICKTTSIVEEKIWVEKSIMLQTELHTNDKSVPLKLQMGLQTTLRLFLKTMFQVVPQMQCAKTYSF